MDTLWETLRSPAFWFIPTYALVSGFITYSVVRDVIYDSSLEQLKRYRRHPLGFAIGVIICFLFMPVMAIIGLIRVIRKK